MNLSTKQKQTHRHREHTYGGQGKGWGNGMNWEFGISRYKLLPIKWIDDKGLLYSTENYIQFPEIDHGGWQIIQKKKKNVYIYIYMTELLCCSSEIGTAL